MQSNSLKPLLKHNSNFLSDPAKRVRLTIYNSALATRKYCSTLPSFSINNPLSEQAPRVRLTQNNTSLAAQKLNSNFNHNNCMYFTSAHASQVHLTQNQLVFAQSFHTPKVNTPNLTNSNPDFASRVRFLHNKITPAGHNHILTDKQYFSHNVNTSFATNVNNYQTKSKFASHSLHTVNTPLQIEPQISSSTGKTPLAYQNQSQFTKLSHFNLSITNKPQIPTSISTKKSHILNNTRAQLTNNKKSFFALIQSENQLSSPFSINLIEKSTTSSKMSQQVSSMKGKSASTRSNRTSPRVSFTDNPTPDTPRRSSSHSNLSTPLTDSPQVLSFEKVVGKVFNKGLIASLTSKDAVLKEVRDCIIRSDEERLKALNPYLHSYWRDLHVSSGCVCMDEKVAIPNALKDALVEDLHASHPGSLVMVSMAQHCWWPYMNRDLLVKAIECKSCTTIGKKLKTVIPAKQFQTHTPCIVPNQEIQIAFAGAIINEKEHEIYILTCIDRFSNYPSAEIFENANASNVIKFLENFIHVHVVPRSLRIDQAPCLIGNQVKNFCTKNNINLIPAPANDHRAIGLVERLY